MVLQITVQRIESVVTYLSILELHDVNEHLYRIGKIVSLEEAPWVLVLGGRLSDGVDPRMTVGPHPRVFLTPSNSLLVSGVLVS